MKKPLLLLIRAYQLGLSPYLGQRCRFYPSCSSYAAEAIAVHGAWSGSVLAAKRLCKCHPWHPGGCDPVPAAGSASAVSAVSSTASVLSQTTSSTTADGCSHS
jgi:putative membrane protein insertion efficiency factor